jgi:hypothetical protein
MYNHMHASLGPPLGYVDTSLCVPQSIIPADISKKNVTQRRQRRAKRNAGMANSDTSVRPSPLLRHFENVCLHVAYKGAMNRQAYAWFHPVANSDQSGTPLPNPPIFSRHVEFIPKADDLRKVKTWWKAEDVNRTVGQFVKYRVTASDLVQGHRPSSVVWLRNTSWFIDVSHGGTPNLWSNICHWSNSIFPFFEAAFTGAACRRQLQHVLLWQVSRAAWAKMPNGYHRGTLDTVISEYQRHAQLGAASPPAEMAPTLHFEEDLPAGMTICFDEVVVVREPNLQHRKVNLQTRSSMSTGGVARGFGSREVRYGFRRAVLAQLRVPRPEPRVPTITHLSRPFGAKDRKLHGSAWQLRCHVKPGTFNRLQKLVFRTAGYRMERVVFEKTTYAYQAKIISETDIFWASHGAGMVHLPLLPKDAVAIEMFNCGHFSYLYASLALNLGVRYFSMQRTEPYCYRPQSLYGDTRKNMSKTYAFLQEEAEPILMQAIRYHMWQDPGLDISGREPRCETARKILHNTGSLPLGMSPKRYSSDCAVITGGGAGSQPRSQLLPRRQRQFMRADPDQGDGSPGQYTRWAGLG